MGFGLRSEVSCEEFEEVRETRFEWFEVWSEVWVVGECGPELRFGRFWPFGRPELIKTVKITT